VCVGSSPARVTISGMASTAVGASATYWTYRCSISPMVEGMVQALGVGIGGQLKPKWLV
jgi:hypothetical protein